MPSPIDRMSSLSVSGSSSDRTLRRSTFSVFDGAGSAESALFIC